jgi:glycosyltransferase involved in cell wall biosynthesis
VIQSFHKLRIGMVAPISERVPPQKYGGTERMVYALTEQLVVRGHDVTLFATGDSITTAKLISVFPRALRQSKIKDPHGLNEWTLLHIMNAYLRRNNFDLIHDHNSIISLPTANLSSTPVIITLHGAVTSLNRRLFEMSKKPYFVSISKSQINSYTNIKTIGNVYNGLQMDSFPFKNTHKGYLLFVGRISMEKGLHNAIDVSLDLNIPLVIAAKLDDADQNYFQEYIKPRLTEKFVTWIGEVDEQERNRLMSEAMCLLHPITWREPFGLTLIESMACGCPVIAFNLGSIPEIVKNGKTGYVVNNVEEMIHAVTKIDRINRKYCRNYALTHFNDKIMAQRYEKLYYTILSENS